MDNTKEYIICSAILKKEPSEKLETYYVCDLHLCEIGFRHHDILNRYVGIVSKSQKDQGFYTSKNRYVNRKEALSIAIECGQVKEGSNPKIGLFSEDIY